jgi:hypothetical protein
MRQWVAEVGTAARGTGGQVTSESRPGGQDSGGRSRGLVLRLWVPQGVSCVHLDPTRASVFFFAF